MGDPDLQQTLNAARSVLKATQRTMRGCLQVLATLEDAIENAEPEERHSENGFKHEHEHRTVTRA